jgi:hypothetical protein
MGWRGRTASPAPLVRLTSQRKHRCMMSCCGSSYGSQGLLLACRLPAALSAAGHAPSSPPGSPPLACHRRLRDRQLRAGRHHLAILVETCAHQHNSFFSSAARGSGRRRHAAQEIHLTAGGARAKAAGKPLRRRIDAARRAGPENHGAAGLGHAQGLFARSRLRRLLRPRPHQRCPRQAHRHRRPRQPRHRYRRQRRFPVRLRRRPRCHRRLALAATTIAIAIAATAYATLSLAAAVATFAFAFAFAAAAQPAQSASAALAALATVEGRGASQIRSRLIETVRSVCVTSWVSRRF